MNGQPSDFKGKRTKKDIVGWINKWTGPPSKEISASQLEDLISKNSFNVVFIGKDGEEFKTFQAAASSDIKWTFYHTFDNNASTKHGISGNKVVIFRNFEEQKLVFEGK